MPGIDDLPRNVRISVKYADIPEYTYPPCTVHEAASTVALLLGDGRGTHLAGALLYIRLEYTS